MTVAQPRATETAVESWAEMNISWTLRTTDAVTASEGDERGDDDRPRQRTHPDQMQGHDAEQPPSRGIPRR